VETRSTARRKHSLQELTRAFGRAHRTASQQMESSMPLLMHLEELRRRLFRALAALVICTLASFLFADKVIGFLSIPLGGKGALVSIEVTENVAIFMRVSLLSGVVLGMPVVVYEALSFLMPGLKENERKWLLAGVGLASLLFVCGVAFTWFVLIPQAIPFLVNFLGITTQIRPANYFEFITRLMFWIGVSFEMPLVVFVLARLKFVTARQLLNGWRYAVVAIAIAAAGITPTVDPVNMGLVMLPLGSLYLISIVMAAVANRD
jgi:sec-independent protein translocase protein TatC